MTQESFTIALLQEGITLTITPKKRNVNNGLGFVW
jgi:hypothetical protein